MKWYRSSMESLGRSLNVCAQKLSLGLVWKELQVFSKLLYRGRNQHRRDKCFQRLIRVSKELRVYQEVALASHVKKFTKLLSMANPCITAQGTSLASRLIDCTHFTVKLLQFIEDTFREVDQRLRMSLFIPFNILMASILSRIWYYLRYHLLALSDTYCIVKKNVLSSSEEFLPSLAAYLGKKHAQTLLKTGKEQLEEQGDYLGTVVRRTNYNVPDSLSVTKMDKEQRRTLSEATVSVIESFPHGNQEGQSVPTEIGDSATSLRRNTTGGAKKFSREQRKLRTTKQANVLQFHFHYGRQRHMRILLRGRKLLAALSARTVKVTGTTFRHLTTLPNGRHIVSTFSISLARLQRRKKSPAFMSKQLPPSNRAVQGEYHTLAPAGCGQWMEAERTRLSQRRSSSPLFVQRLQTKLTEELESAAASCAIAVDVKHLDSTSERDLLLGANSDANVPRNSLKSDDIDNIFVALEKL